MRRLLNVAIILLTSTLALGQAQDIQVFEKKDGNNVIVVARNIGKTTYEVTVDITSSGMQVAPGPKVSAVIPAGYMKEMATLAPIPGQGWSYGYEVSFTESTGRAASGLQANTDAPAQPAADARPATAPAPKLSDAPLIVYTQATCGRCSMAKKELTARGVKFEEVDVNSGSPEVNAMWMKLRENGFTGNSVTMPVIRYNGTYHYDIKDLKGFIDGIK
jgi:glutaredoxin